MDWVQIAVSILSGLAVCIPLVVKLVKYVTEAVQGRRWDELLKLVIANMAEAEGLFATGAERQQGVMKLLAANAASVGYALMPESVEKISAMIDSLCEMAKTVNAGVGDD